MRFLLTWLMVFCVLAGLNARVLAADGSHVAVCSHPPDPCCVEHQGAADGENHPHDGETSPTDHHRHHECCSHVSPLTVESDFVCRLALPGSWLLGFLHESEVAPDEPYLNSEKPPLI